MAEYKRNIEIMECDYYRHLPPSMLLAHCFNMVLSDIHDAGCDRATLYANRGAVWMCSHIRFQQYDFISPGDELIFRTSPRIPEAGRYIFRIEISRGGKLVVNFELAFVPVDKAIRKAVRLSDVDPLWTAPAMENAQPVGLHRLRPDCEFADCGSETVRFSDTDCNHHLTSSAYLSFVCNALDFWGREEPVFMRSMQVDYSSELRPGTAVTMQRGEADGTRYVRGIKPDGTVAFTAACVF